MVKLLLSLLGVCLATTPMMEVAEVQGYNVSSEVPYSETLVGEDAKEYATEMGISDVENVVEIYISNDVLVEDVDVYPYYFGNDYYIKDGTIVTTYERGELIRRSEYEGPSTATMTVSETYSATFSFEFEVGVEELKAKLGYSTSTTFSVSDSYSVNVPSGYTYAIECYTNMERKSFEIWEDDLFFDDYVGDFYSLKPVGCVFVKKTV